MLDNSRAGPTNLLYAQEIAVIIRAEEFKGEMEQTHPATRRSMTLLPLIGATFFMVSGGPYGLEEIVQKAGYSRSILILLITPLIWSWPVALMIGELSAALPEEGGYYAWVRRALGPFWGFQEAWLSLMASIFDMAIYPTLFILYLGQFAPNLVSGTRGFFVGAAVVAVCALWNIAGIRAVGEGSKALMYALLAPFVIVAGLAFFRHNVFPQTLTPQNTSIDLLGGMLIAMWNYMGWDNASTIAQEVERPQRTYPKAMIAAVVLVSLTYVLPFVAVYLTGIPAAQFAEDGSWAAIAGMIGGKIYSFEWLRFLLVAGGMMSAFGMFNALVMSYSRLPLAMAWDGMLPKFFAKISARTKAPWAAIVVCATCWALCLGLGFQRLITLDIMLYGASLSLEFITLVALRIREPELKREFRVPGGLPGAILAGVFPMALLSLAMIKSQSETVLGMNGLLFGAMIIAAGFAAYFVTGRLRKSQAATAHGAFENTETA